MAGEVCADILLVGPGANGTNANGNCFGGSGGIVSCLCCSPFYTDMGYCVHIGQPACAFGKIDSTYILGGGVYVIAQGGPLKCNNMACLGALYCSGGTCNYAGGGGSGAGANGGNASRCYGGGGGAGCFGYGGGGGGWGRYGGGAGCDGGGAGGTGGGAAGGNATTYGSGGGGTCGGTVGCGCQGVVDICYPTDGTYGIHTATGGNSCYTCNGYCVHRFTSDGTFCIIS